MEALEQGGTAMLELIANVILLVLYIVSGFWLTGEVLAILGGMLNGKTKKGRRY